MTTSDKKRSGREHTQHVISSVSAAAAAAEGQYIGGTGSLCRTRRYIPAGAFRPRVMRWQTQLPMIMERFSQGLLLLNVRVSCA